MTVKSKGIWHYGPLVDGGVVQASAPSIPGLSSDPLTRETLVEVRNKLNLTQLRFSEVIGVSLRTVKAWEHHDQSHPEYRSCTGAARVLIRLLAQHPHLMEKI